MRFVIFCHSLVSDWNHGNAHFLRGIVRQLLARHHQVDVYEPAEGWSRLNLQRDHGPQPLQDFARAYPELRSTAYDVAELLLKQILEGADVVLVHEWNDYELVSRIGRQRADGGDFLLFFHDTHHRGVSQPQSMAQYDLSHYDGVLAFGRVLRDLYLEKRWTDQAWVWHEAADPTVFHPDPATPVTSDLVWIGNWGDGERTQELQQYLLEPVRQLGLQATVYGVRYPASAQANLRQAGIDYRGWLPNFRVPEIFARHRVTIHVPRRPYRETLRGIPTIRVFEALACGIPLVSGPWEDSEGLFTIGRDFLMARNAQEMQWLLRELIHQPEWAQEIAQRGRETILARHTCSHRVDQLLEICRQLGKAEASETTAQETSAGPAAPQLQ